MKYILQHGKHVGYETDDNGNPTLNGHPVPEGKKPGRKVYTKGDIVHLDPDQAVQFGDKFKSTEVVDAEKRVLAAKDDEIARLIRERDEAALKLTMIQQGKMTFDGKLVEAPAKDIESAKNPPAAGPANAATSPVPGVGQAPAAQSNTAAPSATGPTTTK